MAGADVTVIAPEIDARIEALSDVITIERRADDAGDVTGFRLVITTTNDAAVNARVFDDAEAAGIWVNSADDIDHCSFTLPAVHRDGAVTVAVATDGQSPAFAAWLRDRLRDALPIGVGEIAERLAAERRALHEAGATTEGLDWRARIDQLAANAEPVGTVHLVGAGPGDPELLTLRGRGPPRGRRRCRARRARGYRGARARAPARRAASTSASAPDVRSRQELINDLLVAARPPSTRCVVRLKGGDPFVFGRGGEEALALQAAGVAVRGRAGHHLGVRGAGRRGHARDPRGMSRARHRRHRPSPLRRRGLDDWEALARVGGTIVVLMGVAERGRDRAPPHRRRPSSRDARDRGALRHAARAAGRAHDARRAG